MENNSGRHRSSSTLPKSLSSSLQRRPERLPDLEFGVVARFFGARALPARGDVQSLLENLAAHLFGCLFLFEDRPGVDIDIAVHAGEGGIRADLHHRSERAADARAAP